MRDRPLMLIEAWIATGESSGKSIIVLFLLCFLNREK